MAETSGILRQLAAHAREDARIYREKGSGPATRADAETVADAMDIAAGARERLADALDEIARLRAEVARLEVERDTTPSELKALRAEASARARRVDVEVNLRHEAERTIAERDAEIARLKGLPPRLISCCHEFGKWCDACVGGLVEQHNQQTRTLVAVREKATALHAELHGLWNGHIPQGEGVGNSVRVSADLLALLGELEHEGGGR